MSTPPGREIAYVECTACGRLVQLPPEHLRGRVGPALYRSLRCSGCGALGKVEVRFVWRVGVPEREG